MIHGQVVGEIWATRKSAGLEGLPFLLVRTDLPAEIVAADLVGAGVGDHVIVTFGAAARIALRERPETPIEAAIIAIVDDFSRSSVLAPHAGAAELAPPDSASSTSQPPSATGAAKGRGGVARPRAKRAARDPVDETPKHSAKASRGDFGPDASSDVPDGTPPSVASAADAGGPETAPKTPAPDAPPPRTKAPRPRGARMADRPAEVNGELFPLHPDDVSAEEPRVDYDDETPDVVGFGDVDDIWNAAAPDDGRRDDENEA